MTSPTSDAAPAHALAATTASRWRLLAELSDLLSSHVDLPHALDHAVDAIGRRLSCTVQLDVVAGPAPAPLTARNHPATGDDPADERRAATVVLQTENRRLGTLCCRRPTGEPEFSAAERFAITAVATTIANRLEALGARTAERAARARAERIFTQASIGMVLTDAAGTVREVNPAGAAILGRASGDITGRPGIEMVHPDDRAAVTALVEDRIATGSTRLAFTARTLCPDGTTRWARVHGHVVYSGPQGTPSMFGQFVDVTDQYEIEAEIDRFAAVLESVPDFVVTADLDGRVRWINPAGHALVSLPAGVDVATTVLDDYLAAAPGTPTVDRVLAAGSVDEEVLLRDWSGGEPIAASALTFVIRDIHTDEPIGLAGLRRDQRSAHESRRELENLVRQRTALLGELLEAEQLERTRLAGDIHDESVQLLAAAQLRLQLLTPALRRGDTDAAHRAIDGVRDLVVRSLEELRRLLTGLQLPASPGDNILQILREQAHDLFAGSSTRVTIEGGFGNAPDSVAAVLVRSAREALSNARRHARAEHVRVRVSEDRDQWRVEVSDDGVGMPATLQLRLGHLGITTMSRRVEALEGRCRIDSAPGAGTRITLTVPRPAEPTAGAPG